MHDIEKHLLSATMLRRIHIVLCSLLFWENVAGLLTKWQHWSMFIH